MTSGESLPDAPTSEVTIEEIKEFVGGYNEWVRAGNGPRTYPTDKLHIPVNPRRRGAIDPTDYKSMSSGELIAVHAYEDLVEADELVPAAALRRLDSANAQTDFARRVVEYLDEQGRPLPA